MSKRAGRGVARAFFDNIAPAVECVLWPFAKGTGGYGIVQIDSSPRYVHRLICEKFHGPCPPGKMHVAHSCGTPACINPSHLRWASARENQADRLFHGTTSRGERNGLAKLTRKQVLAIRSDTRTQRKVSAEYGVSQTTVYDIKKRNSWSWLV